MRLLLPLVGALLAGCAPATKPSPVKQLARQKTPAEEAPAEGDPGALNVMRFHGKQRIAALTRATRAESYRVAPGAGGEGVEGDLHGHKITAQGPELTAAQLNELRALILDDASYVWMIDKECRFKPGVAVRLYGGDPNLLPLDVLLCFSCDQWAFANHGEPKVEDNDPVRNKLLVLAQALFPDDPAIQGLKPNTPKPGKKQ